MRCPQLAKLYILVANVNHLNDGDILSQSLYIPLPNYTSCDYLHSRHIMCVVVPSYRTQNLESCLRRLGLINTDQITAEYITVTALVS